MLDVIEMRHHNRCGPCAIASLHRGGQVFVLVILARRYAWRRVVQRDDQTCKRAQFAHRLQQERIAGHLSHEDVELASEPDNSAPIIARAGVELDVPAEPGELFLGCGLRQLLCEGRFDQPSRVEHVARFLDGRARNERSPVRIDRKDAVVRKPPERLTYFGAAYAEHFCEPLFDKLGSRWQPMFPDRDEHLFGDRIDCRRRFTRLRSGPMCLSCVD